MTPFSLLKQIRDAGVKVKCIWEDGKLLDWSFDGKRFGKEFHAAIERHSVALRSLISEIYAPVQNGECPEWIKLKRQKNGIKAGWYDAGQFVGKIFKPDRVKGRRK